MSHPLLPLVKAAGTEESAAAVLADERRGRGVTSTEGSA